MKEKAIFEFEHSETKPSKAEVTEMMDKAIGEGYLTAFHQSEILKYYDSSPWLQRQLRRIYLFIPSTDFTKLSARTVLRTFWNSLQSDFLLYTKNESNKMSFDNFVHTDEGTFEHRDTVDPLIKKPPEK